MYESKDDGEVLLQQDPPKLSLKKIVDALNVAELLKDTQLSAIGAMTVNDYNADKSTRREWEQRMESATKLAMQFREGKDFPWQNCSNVKFPLVTVGALQFLARVSILTKGRNIVKCDVIGNDPDGREGARSKRIGTHMSYQLVEEDVDWVDDDEKTKFHACLIGCGFKKSFFDSSDECNKSEFVPASDLVVDYYTKTLDKANRVTQVLHLTSNAIIERERRGLFLPMVSKQSSQPEMNLLVQASDDIAGIKGPMSGTDDVFEVLEQHRWLDLDGDGYKEPYVVFVRKDTAQTLRITPRFFDEGDVKRVHDTAVRRLRQNASSTSSAEAKARYEGSANDLEASYDNRICKITAQNYFTKYPFIPSPDGGFYDFGLGALLGPVNESVNSMINQLIDAGTMQVTAGGFLGRGVKIKAGKNSFDPFEWKPVDSTGDDLRKNIFPLPVNAPSDVLFRLLGILIQYGEKISGATDIMTGVSPGQNTPAETSRNTLEQGMKLFSGIYGRMHRAFTRELKKLYALNQLYLETTPTYIQLSSGTGALISQGDYRKGLFKVQPAADVNVTSEAQRQQKAIMVKQAAATTPGYNRYLVEKRFLEAFDVEDHELLYPDPQGPNAVPPPQNPKIEIEKQKLQLQMQEQQDNMQIAVVELKLEGALNAAKIMELQAKAEKLLAEAKGAETMQQVAVINTQIGAARAHQDGMAKALEILQKSVETRQKRQQLDKESDTSHGSDSTGSKGLEAAPSN